MKRNALITAAIIAALATIPTRAHARAVEFMVGGGAGYEWFDLSALEYGDLLDPSNVSSTGEYSAPLNKYKGSSFIFDAWAGVKILSFALAVDYRGSFTMDTLNFSQLMGDFTFFIPTKKVIPFIKLGAGYVWMKAVMKDDSEGHDPPLNTLEARGIGARIGGGVDFRLIKFLSFGIGCEVGFLYFTNKHGKSWGMNVDLLGRVQFHI